MPIRTTTRQNMPADLFEVTDDSVPSGFCYAPNLFSAAEEKNFVAQLESLPFKPFEFHGYLGNRRVVSFGYRYDYAGRALREASQMPEFLAPLRDVAGQFSGIPAAALEQALITEYAPGAGIGWHRDKPMFQDVVALSFLSSCRLRFRRRDGAGWQRAAVEVAPRSAYLLRAAAREEWQHSIPALDRLRYSVTFRNFRR